MRKLMYVGRNKWNEVVETASYERMNELKKEGYTFKEVMREVEIQPTDKEAETLARRRAERAAARETKKYTA